jgi:hypothetical protein
VALAAAAVATVAATAMVEAVVTAAAPVVAAQVALAVVAAHAGLVAREVARLGVNFDQLQLCSTPNQGALAAPFPWKPIS